MYETWPECPYCNGYGFRKAFKDGSHYQCPVCAEVCRLTRELNRAEELLKVERGGHPPLIGQTYIPMSECPNCGHKQEDWDGFGVVYCQECGYCTHPSQVGTGSDTSESTTWLCGLCGKTVTDKAKGEGNDNNQQ